MTTVYLLSKERTNAPYASKVVAIAATLHEAKEVIDNSGTFVEWESVPSSVIRPRWVGTTLPAAEYFWVIEAWSIIGA